MCLLDPNKQYALIINASPRARDFPGGLGAILTQLDNKGLFLAVAYASRLQLDEEKQFFAYLLEMRAMVWDTRHFQNQLQGQGYILLSAGHAMLETPVPI